MADRNIRMRKKNGAAWDVLYPITKWSNITNKPIFDVKDYGAIGDGVTNDTAAIALAVGAITTAGGGILLFPAGTYLVTAAVDIAISIIIQGAGRMRSIIQSNSASADIFRIDADGVLIEGLNIRRTVTATAGATGIKLLDGSHVTMQHCQISDHYYNLHCVDGDIFTLFDNYFVSPIKYSVYIQNTASPDTGDQVISACVFDTGLDSDAAIRHESGGGLKLTSNKIVHHKRGYDLQVADGVATSVLTITGNSIEGQSVSSIRLGRMGTTGTYEKITISGNQFSSPTSIVLGPGVRGIKIGNNVHANNGSSVAVDLTIGAAQVYISAEEISDFDTGIRIAAGASDIKVGDCHYYNVGTPVENNATLTDVADVQQSLIANFAVTSDSVYTNLYRIDMDTYRGCTIDLTTEGVIQGVGVFSRHVRKVISHGGSTCTVTDDGDTAGGAVIDLRFDVSTTSGSVLIGIRRNAAGGGTEVDGNITLRVSGHAQKVSYM